MRSLATFIRQHRERILDEWLEAATHLPSAHNLPLPAIRDHVPEILDAIAEAVDRDDQTATHLNGLPNLHAAIRLREGYDLRQVIFEYRALRQVILGLYARSGDISDDSRPKLAPLREMDAALDAAISDAVDQYALDKDRAREMFIGMLGHDLRDPLQTISFTAKVLWDRGDQLDAHTLKSAARIHASATRMESMIRDLLDFARGRLGGGLPIVPEWLDAGPLVHTAVDEVAHAHPDRNIQCCGMDGGDFRVHWDGDRVAQAIANLLGNAVAHGGDPIAVELFDLGDEIAIDVRNRGAIPPSILPRLFEPFSEPVPDRRRAAQPHEGAERRRHLGLGLYIVREISVAHGGQVDAASRDGEAIFRITLPRHAHPTQPMPTEVGPEIAVHARVSERRGDGDDRRRFSRTDRRKPLV